MHVYEGIAAMVNARTSPRVKGNRLVEVVLESGGDETTIAAYEYDGRNRRTMKTVSNCGVEDTANDGGNTTVHYYYSDKWQILETRNGSSQTTFQYVWGTQYVDELVMIDRNGDPTESNDCDPDEQSGESTADERYFVHQDRNWNVVALTDYDEGNVVERYHYTPYGQFIVLSGDSGSGEMGNVLPTSTVGNVFCFQGLHRDQESGTDQQRHRQRQAAGRFAQRDPLTYADGPDLYAAFAAGPGHRTDPSGLMWIGECNDCIDDAIQNDAQIRALYECAKKVPPGRTFPCFGNALCFPCYHCGGWYNPFCFSGDIGICAPCVRDCDDVKSVLRHELVHAIMMCRRFFPQWGGHDFGPTRCTACLVHELFAYYYQGECITYEDCIKEAKKSCKKSWSCIGDTTSDEQWVEQHWGTRLTEIPDLISDYCDQLE